MSILIVIAEYDSSSTIKIWALERYIKSNFKLKKAKHAAHD